MKPKKKKLNPQLVIGNQFIFDTPVDAWDKLIKMFLVQDPTLFEKGHGSLITNAGYTNDLTLYIANPKFDDDFDFGKMFNYSQTKWTSLVSNYVNLDNLDDIREKIKELEFDKAKNRNYNIGFQFADNHGNGKGCLLSGILSRSHYTEKPIISISIRSSEIVTRLPFDLLFFSRLGQYIYGHLDWTLRIDIKQAFADDNVILLYDNREPLVSIFDNDNNDEVRRKDILGRLEEVKSSDSEKYAGYQAYLRAFKVLRPDLHTTKTLLAKDLEIGNWDGLPIPRPCPTVMERNKIKEVYLKLCEKMGLDPSQIVIKGKNHKKRKVLKMK